MNWGGGGGGGGENTKILISQSELKLLRSTHGMGIWESTHSLCKLADLEGVGHFLMLFVGKYKFSALHNIFHFWFLFTSMQLVKMKNRVIYTLEISISAYYCSTV